MTLRPSTRAAITRLFDRLDYARLADIYCEEGGAAFWQARKAACRTLGSRLAERLKGRLPPRGRSLYVGAGVAELPVLVMETLELEREVAVFTLRRKEAGILNRACAGLPFRYRAQDARRARGRFDHLWIVSVLNDPERFPELSALSYGRADPVIFEPRVFVRERRAVTALVDAVMRDLRHPALVTTSVEELPWIAAWCARHAVPCAVGAHRHPTALVGDPVCFVRVGA